MSMLFTVDSSTSTSSTATGGDIEIDFPTAIELPYDAELALVSSDHWYSWYNISAEYGNNKFRYYNGVSYVDIVIPDGAYQVEQLDAYIKQIMYDAGDYDSTTTPGTPIYYIELIPNLATLKLRIKITGAGYKVDFTALGNGTTLHEILGFTAIEISSTQEGANQVDITRGINTLQIHCDALASTYKNGVKSDVLYSFIPSTYPGGAIHVEPTARIYLPLKFRQIRSLRMYITDQRGRMINFNGQPSTYLLHVRPVRQIV